MIDLSRQQRWVIIAVVCAFVVGAAVLTARSGLGRQAEVYSLEEPAEQVGEQVREEPATITCTEDNPVQVVSNICFVHVCGAVQNPGVYQLPEGARCFQAIEAAGGATPEADTAAINLAAKIVDGEQIYLPKQGEASPAASRTASGGRPIKKKEAARPSWPLDLNTATADQLEAVPGIGPAMAARILAYRAEKGRFTSLDQLTEVPGIGNKRLAQLRAYLCVR